MCGEKSRKYLISGYHPGSPPRVRGKGRSPVTGRSTRRITPACAGKRYLRATRIRTTRDHPRVCGEKRVQRATPELTEGSPPRVRGKGLSQAIVSSRVRITPACAGKSYLFNMERRLQRDHPRVCGEKGALIADEAGVQGSPPRARGKVFLRFLAGEEYGITPACAGKRRCEPKRLCAGRDHPRVCGEKVVRVSETNRTGGSPPRVRGKAIPSSIFIVLSGITPACAGKRLKKALKNKDF